MSFHAPIAIAWTFSDRLALAGGEALSHRQHRRRSPLLSRHSLTGGELALCNEDGNVIFHVSAEEGFLYFENSDRERLMRLDDKDGNLVVKGTVTPNGMP